MFSLTKAVESFEYELDGCNEKILKDFDKSYFGVGKSGFVKS